MEKNVVLSYNSINHSTPKKISQMQTVSSLIDIDNNTSWVPIIINDPKTLSNKNARIALSSLFSYNAEYTNQATLNGFSYSTSYLSYIISYVNDGTMGYINSSIGYLTNQVSNLQIQLQYGAIVAISQLNQQFTEMLKITQNTTFEETANIIQNSTNRYSYAISSYTKEWVDREYDDDIKKFRNLYDVSTAENLVDLSYKISNEPISYTLTSYNMQYTNYRLGWQILP